MTSWEVKQIAKLASYHLMQLAMARYIKRIDDYDYRICVQENRAFCERAAWLRNRTRMEEQGVLKFIEEVTK